MTAHEFISATVGRVQWKKYAADWQFMDCFGLLAMYFYHVCGVTVARGNDMAEYASLGWQEVADPAPNAPAFMAWRDGKPWHCGVCIGDGLLLHCDGNEQMAGGVRINTIEAVQKIYGEIRFYAYHPA